MSGREPIQLLAPDDARWARVVAERPDASIFHHPAWINLLARCYRYRPFVVAVIGPGEVLRAGLPMMDVRSLLTGRRWVALPFSDHCAPLAVDAHALHDLTDALVGALDARLAPRITVHAALPQHSRVQTSTSHVLHTVALEPDASAVAARFHSMHRRNIQAATKKGVRVEQGVRLDQIAAFYQLHLETRRHQGTPVQPWRFFRAIGALIAQGLGFVLLAYHAERCIAGAIFLHHGRTLVYKYGASRRDALELRPNNLLFDHAIRWGCQNGYQLFDLGRTDLANSGLRDFKAKWGATERPLPYSVAPVAGRSRADGRLMHTLQTLIRHSPSWMCRALGEVLYRHVA